MLKKPNISLWTQERDNIKNHSSDNMIQTRCYYVFGKVKDKTEKASIKFLLGERCKVKGKTL